jgi:PII-like signaling protein
VDEDGIMLTSYFGERRRLNGQFVADALLESFSQRKVASSIVLRGTEGFGLKHHIRTNHSLSLSEDLPLIVTAVDASSRIGDALGEVRRINRRGLITVERTRFLSGDIEAIGFPGTADGRATKLTVYFCRQDSVFGVPAFEVMCELLHRRGIGGATALAGVDGTAQGRRHRAHFFSRNGDVPMMVVAVGPDKSVGALLPELGDLLRSPRITLDQVQVCKRDGELINEPEAPSAYDEDGMALWQKLTVYASGTSRHSGQPIHRSLIRRLLSAGISGATTQEGIWGFRGEHAPHGDQHLLQFGHHVPAMTVVIDTPQRIPVAFGIIDELTAEHGLVTCENIPVIAPVVDG